MNKVYEVYVPVHVGTYESYCRVRRQAIDILYDRFRDSKEVHEHLKTSTDWFTDPRHSEIAKEVIGFVEVNCMNMMRVDEVVLSKRVRNNLGWEES